MSVSEAATSGDVERLRALLEAGGDPNEKETEEHGPPLLKAAQADHVEAARLLLDAGADLYGPNEGGETPLVMAVQNGSLGVFRLLVERGYRMDAVRDNASWMLTEAARRGQSEMVRWLLAQGADVDLTDFQGCTALTYAAHGDHLELVEELLKAGANPDHRDNDTETVLMWAADHAGNAPVIRALLQGRADVNAKNNFAGTALSWAMRHGDADMVKALLDAGADANGASDLIRAAFYGFVPALRLLLEHGADIRATDSNGQTALALAKNRGHREAANLLRQAEADRSLQETGETYPRPRYAMGTPVRTRTYPAREGWIVLAEWHHKHGRYGYFIEVEGTTQARKTVSRRYWEEDLQVIEPDDSGQSAPELRGCRKTL
jgi:ankyrin repeat protein